MLEVVEGLVALQIENLGIALVASLQSDELTIGIIGQRSTENMIVHIVLTARAVGHELLVLCLRILGVDAIFHYPYLQTTFHAVARRQIHQHGII